MSPDTCDDGWATRPQDTRERTCECGLGPLSVLHTLRVTRHPDPTTVTVARTHEATVEWTADCDLPGWLRAVAEVCPAYVADRFGGSNPRPDPGDGLDGASADGRFRVAPVDATVRPPGGPPGLSDPYHYWNTPLSRLLADDNYPDAVASLALDLLAGPEAVWAARATAGVDPGTLPGARDDYARVGLEFTARERFRRPTGGSGPGDSGGVTGDSGDSTGDPAATGGTGNADAPWERAGDPVAPATDRLAPAVDSTLSPAVRDGPADGSVVEAVETVERQIHRVWGAFRRREGEDPYAIPDRAVDAATSSPDEGPG